MRPTDRHAPVTFPRLALPSWRGRRRVVAILHAYRQKLYVIEPRCRLAWLQLSALRLTPLARSLLDCSVACSIAGETWLTRPKGSIVVEGQARR